MAVYTTIEPRLIALLNDSTPEPFVPYPRLESLDLPPLDHNIHKVSGRPSPIEPDASIHNENRSILNAQQNAPIDRDSIENTTLSNSNGRDPQQGPFATDWAVGCTSPQSLQRILDDFPVASQSQTSRRRQRQDSSKDEFVQLPQPPKKQKAVTQVVPPIIIGLFEPPPNAALFPPIASSSFHDSHGRNSLNIGPSNEPTNRASSDAQPKSIDQPKIETQGKKFVTRTRKKWSDEETNQLLLGVQAHGVGNWTKILQDPEFKFDRRRAVDLKDRFRTCCPTELCGKSQRRSFTRADDSNMNGISMPQSQPIPNVEGGLVESDSSSTDDKVDSAVTKGSQKSRAHRKRLKDLAELGIKEPFKKSRRRERRPFSEAEDQDILQGFQEYGTAWTRILMDSRFNVKSRRATDLRDRLRNRYPEKYFLLDHGRDSTKETFGFASQTIAQPSSHASGSQDSPRASKLLAQPSMSGSFAKDTYLNFVDNPTLVETADPLSFDWTDNIGPFQSTIADMDISRILLDDTWSSKKIG